MPRDVGNVSGVTGSFLYSSTRGYPNGIRRGAASHQRHCRDSLDPYPTSQAIVARCKQAPGNEDCFKDLYESDYLFAAAVSADQRLKDKDMNYVHPQLVHHIERGIFEPVGSELRPSLDLQRSLRYSAGGLAMTFKYISNLRREVSSLVA